jgi:hypothetical protein
MSPRSRRGGRSARSGGRSAALPGFVGRWYPAGRRRAVKPGGGHRAEIAQLVEHATENRGVASSILALGTTPKVAADERKWLSW